MGVVVVVVVAVAVAAAAAALLSLLPLPLLPSLLAPVALLRLTAKQTVLAPWAAAAFADHLHLPAPDPAVESSVAASSRLLRGLANASRDLLCGHMLHCNLQMHNEMSSAMLSSAS